jgi:hypothetical protein
LASVTPYIAPKNLYGPSKPFSHFEFAIWVRLVTGTQEH